MAAEFQAAFILLGADVDETAGYAVTSPYASIGAKTWP